MQLMLQNESVDSDVNLNEIGNLTEGFSGSDLSELCRSSAMFRVMEYSNTLQNSPVSEEIRPHVNELRTITMADFVAAVNQMKESKLTLSSGYSAIGLD